MLKMLIAYTLAIDDVDAAVSEILSQLDIEKNLLKHSAGMLSCYSEFIDTGVVKALCDRLPFDVVGTTTLANAAPGEVSQMMLTLAVLTSDDIVFSTAVSESLLEKQEESVAPAYARASAALPGKPSLMFTFMPLIYNVGGDQLIDLLNKLSGGVTNFGTVTVDHTMDYHTARVFHNGEAYNDRLSMLLLHGDVRPAFYVASLSEENIMKQKAIITASDGNVLKEVNNMPILQYMETLGLSRDGRIDGANAIPFIIDYNDGTTPVARAIYATTPDGYAVCGGSMPVGATLSIGSLDMDEVLSTSREMIAAAKAKGNVGGLLIFSCLSRNLALGMDTLAEMEAVQEGVGGDIPYQFTYSGGEICPVYSVDGKLINRFHNDTIIACVL